MTNLRIALLNLGAILSGLGYSPYSVGDTLELSDRSLEVGKWELITDADESFLTYIKDGTISNVASIDDAGYDVTGFELTKTVQLLHGPGEWKEYYDVVDISDDYNDYTYLRIVPLDEIERRQAKANTGMAAGELAAGLRLYGNASMMVGEAVEKELGGKSPIMSPKFFEKAYLGAKGDQADGLTNIVCSVAQEKMDVRYSDVKTANAQQGLESYISPQAIMMENACFLYAAALVFDAVDADVNEEAEARRRDAEEAVKKIHYGGTESVNGRPAHRLALFNVNLKQQTDDGQVATIRHMGKWVDAEHFGEVKMRMEGIVEDGNETREFFMERELTDYRMVPNTTMNHPYREVLRMGGMLGPEELAELKEAEAKMAEFEQQMASMPASQRAMMERMMGPQIEQMRNLVKNGTFETEIITTKVVINPDFKLGGAGVDMPSQEDALLQRIQVDLRTLGYEPGNTHGELSKATVAAIVSFQSDNNMELTGKPSPQLAGILAEKVKQGN